MHIASPPPLPRSRRRRPVQRSMNTVLDNITGSAVQCSAVQMGANVNASGSLLLLASLVRSAPISDFYFGLLDSFLFACKLSKCHHHRRHSASVCVCVMFVCGAYFSLCLYSLSLEILAACLPLRCVQRQFDTTTTTAAMTLTTPTNKGERTSSTSFMANVDHEHTRTVRRPFVRPSNGHCRWMRKPQQRRHRRRRRRLLQPVTAAADIIRCVCR